MLSEIPERRKEEYACLLVFDVKVLGDAQKYAEENGIKIFTANIIYHLTSHFTKHVEEVRRKRKEKEGKDAVFPCILKQVATFRKCDPIVLGVDVEYGVLKIGTPICIYKEKEVHFYPCVEKRGQANKVGHCPVDLAQPQKADRSQEGDRISGNRAGRGPEHNVRETLRPEGQAGVGGEPEIDRLPEGALQGRSAQG